MLKDEKHGSGMYLFHHSNCHEKLTYNGVLLEYGKSCKAATVQHTAHWNKNKMNDNENRQTSKKTKRMRELSLVFCQI